MLTKQVSSYIIIHVVSARATTTAILENDIVKTDKQEKFAKTAKARAGARANKRTVRFLRETTVF